MFFIKRNKSDKPILLLICLVTTILFCTLLSVCGLKNKETEAYALDSNATAKNEDYAYINLKEDHVVETTVLNIPVSVVSESVIVDFTYEETDFEVLSSKTENSHNLLFTLKCLFFGEHELHIHIKMSDKTELSASLYAFCTDFGIFLSTFSRNDALKKYIDYTLNNSILTESEAEELIEKLSSKSSIDEDDTLEVNNTSTKNKRSIAKSSTRSGDTTAYGTLTWNDGRTGDIAIHPLRRIKVELRDSDLIGSQLLGTTFTENDGSYSISFTNDSSVLENGGCDLFLRIFAGDDNADVVKSDGTTKYYVDTPYTDHQNVATGISEMIDHTINMSTYAGKAIQISQALMTAQDFAWDMIGGEDMPDPVTVRYPYGTSSCYYDNNVITITGAERESENFPHAYASWDVIMHEYGHHIEHIMNIVGEDAHGDHSFGQILANTYGKNRGIELAWSEAWATCFSGVAQKYHSSELAGIETTNDQVHLSYNGVNFNYETAMSYFYTSVLFTDGGESCEGSVLAVLWDLFDNASEENDTISLGYQAWWDITTGSHATTFSDFIQYFYQQYPDYKDDIGKNLSYYQMAPTGVATSTSSTVLTDTPPKFVWDPQGGSTLYPNNSFQIMIFSEDYANSITTTTISSATMTITDNNWNDILSWVGEVIHVTVIGYQTTTPATGGYYSIYKDFTKPIFRTNIKSDNTIEIIGTYCDVLGELEIPSSFNDIPVSGIAAQAFRSRNLTSVSLPSTVEYIEKNAFQYCYNLTHVYMSSTSVSRIEEYTFDSCPITYISFPSGITYIGNRAFRNTDNIGNIPKSVTYIGPYAFANSNLTAIIIPMTLTNIDTYAFSGCTSLSVYTEQTSRPSTWNSNWNPTNRPVVWGCTLSSDKSYVVSFTKSSGNPTGANAISNLANPLRSGYTFSNWYTKGEDNSTTNYSALSDVPNNSLVYISWSKSSCIAAGSLITLADGSRVAVEDLTGEEDLLVWNMLTGQYDTAPILFIDSDPLSSYEIIKLTFSDNTEVKVIDEHAFFDMTIGKYVFMRNDASQYIGHYFNKQGINGTYTTVQLINVTVYNETTTTWSPVTYGHLCYYVNGMLSMPGATEGLINIFDVDTTLMKYDAVQMAADIQTYGLYTYEEFNAIIPLPELVFNAFNGQYLKVSIGKGLITLDEIAALLERYAAFFE